MSLFLLSVHMDVAMKEVKMGMGRMGMRFPDEGESEDCLTYCVQMVGIIGESEEDLKVLVRRFVNVCRRRSLKGQGDGIRNDHYGRQLKNLSRFLSTRFPC